MDEPNKASPVRKGPDVGDTGEPCTSARIEPDIIRQQVQWLPARNPEVNPMGLLRRAIEQNWPAPQSAAVKEKKRASDAKAKRELEQRESEDLEWQEKQLAKKRRRDPLLVIYRDLS